MASKKKQERPKQERGKRTRENLLQAATQSLVENHLYGLRFAQISKIAEVPQPLMDYHFPSLEALLMEMITHQLDKYKIASLEAIQTHQNKPRKMLDAYIRVTFELSESDAGFRAVWSSYYHLATVNKNFADFNRAVRRTGNERLVQLVSAVIQAEKRRHSTSAKLVQETATAIQGIITGHGFMAAAESSGDFKGLADLAVKASFQVLEANFPS
jgi:AcrR family transcriptional regulator